MTDADVARTAEGGDAAAARSRYQSWLAEIEVETARLTARDTRLGTVRVIVFLIAVMLWLLSFVAQPGLAFGVAGTIAFFGFIAVAAFNEPIRDALDECGARRAVVRRLLARLDRDWKQLESPELADKLADVELSELERDTATDLDLFGTASLFQLLSLASTTMGIATLAQWLTRPAIAEVATERAHAIESLAPRVDDRLRFYVLTRAVGRGGGDPARFVAWASGERWLASRGWMVGWANASALIVAALVVGMILGGPSWIPFVGSAGSAVALLMLGVVNLTLSAALLGPAHEIFAAAIASRRAVAEYQELFAAADWLPHDSGNADAGLLSRIRGALLTGDRAASAGMAKLTGIAKAASLKQSAGTFLLYLPLQALALWDVRVLMRLEQWQASYGPQTRQWFSALGELEALVSLAALREEYPGWASPSWLDRDQQAVLSAERLGHPLLRDDVRVGNDVTIGPPGSILLVTGSNMSGKSTMLRSVGLNVALAAAGAPVCARRFVLPSVELATSIRVRDDVSDGVSFYMAELKRLKQVVDRGRELNQDCDRTLLFLLDEILQGTNSRERQIAVVRVLDTLAELCTIGAITTHDLELADEPELSSRATTVHFRETIRPHADGSERMTFDYQMHDGISPTTNALRLLEMVGLGNSASLSEEPGPNQPPN